MFLNKKKYLFLNNFSKMYKALPFTIFQICLTSPSTSTKSYFPTFFLSQMLLKLNVFKILRYLTKYCNFRTNIAILNPYFGKVRKLQGLSTCFKCFTRKYVLGWADSAPPPRWNRVKEKNFF